MNSNEETIDLRLTAAVAEPAMEALMDEFGFAYDEDFTALYGDQWQLTGIRFMGPRARTVLSALSRILERED